MQEKADKVKLKRKGDQVLARMAGRDEVPVRLVWARPISGRGGEVSVLGEGKKELLMLDSLDALDPESRRIAEEELEGSYLIPKITTVLKTEANFGNRYWQVDTDRGRRMFLMKDPNINVTWISEDHLVIRDTLGNRYEIESLSALDEASRAWIDHVV